MITAEESLLINIPRIRLCSAYCNYLSVAYQWTDRHEITDLRGCAVVTQFAIYAVQCRIPAVVEKGAVWHTASSNGASKFAPGHLQFFCLAGSSVTARAFTARPLSHPHLKTVPWPPTACADQRQSRNQAWPLCRP